jgi:hypothetical protein
MTEDEFRRIDLLIMKRVNPRKIRGSEKASDMLGITSSALRMRMASGRYCEGVHYKKDGKITMWDRDNLLKEEFKDELSN